MTISIINGPNLNMLGKRNPEIYGHETFEETLTGIRKKFPETEIRFFQSNSEGEIIDMIQRENADPAIAGCILLGCGFMFPPKGEIHSSVLVAFGEILTFAGALFGIDYHYRREGR